MSPAARWAVAAVALAAAAGAMFYLWQGGRAETGVLRVETRGSLPAALSGNAVAGHWRSGRPVYYSFGGTAGDTGAPAPNLVFEPRRERAARDGVLPEAAGHGASAAALSGRLYVFTGARDGTGPGETWRVDPRAGKAIERAPMPRPVAGAVALPHAGRWIYLIGGDTAEGPTGEVQVFDARENLWRQATPLPGPAASGPAASLYGRTLVVIDGAVTEEGGRGPAPRPAAWAGIIDETDPAVIDWQPLPHHGGPPLYRAVAVAQPGGRVVFFGGADRYYASEREAGVLASPGRVFGFDLGDGRWREIGWLSKPLGGVRDAVLDGRWVYVLGGIDESGRATDRVHRFKLPRLDRSTPAERHLDGEVAAAR